MIWTKRRFFVSALIALSGLHLSLAAPTPGQERPGEKSNPLQLTVTLFAQHDCADRNIENPPVQGAVVGKVLFDAHLRIRNVSGHAMILRGKCVVAESFNLFDSKADDSRGAVSTEGLMLGTFGLTARAHPPPRPNSDYPVIARGGELEIDRTAGVDWVIFSTNHAPGCAWEYPGYYFFQPRFVTWEQPDPGTNELARR